MKTPLSDRQLIALTESMRDAYYEMCATGECQCVTIDEHERNLKLAAERDKREKK